MMKKYYCFAGILAAGMIVFSSCSKEDEIINSNQSGSEEDTTQEIILQVANTGDGLTTKAGRPLLSSEAKQSIDKVKVVILNTDNNVVAETLFEDWSTDVVSQIYDDKSGHGRQATWKLTGENKLAADNTYKVYALGYTSDGSLYSATTSGDFENWKVGVDSKKLPISSKISIDEGLGEEIFAGEIAEIEVDGNGEFIISKEGNENVLTLHRQVSGVLGYFTSIPIYKPGTTIEEFGHAKKGTKLRMVSYGLNTEIVFDRFNTSFTENGAEGSDVMYVVNGMTAASNKDGYFSNPNGFDLDKNKKAYVLYEINLEDWFKHGDVNNDGILDENDASNDGDYDTPSYVLGATFKPGSVFAGQFIIPFKGDVEKREQKTLELQLLANDGTLIRKWDVRLASGDPQIDPDAQHVTLVSKENDGSYNWTVNKSGEDRSYFSLVRNHLYTIGSKQTDVYDPGTDEPEDLSKGQNLILKINDNWEMIHNMEIE